MTKWPLPSPAASPKATTKMGTLAVRSSNPSPEMLASAVLPAYEIVLRSLSWRNVWRTTRSVRPRQSINRVYTSVRTRAEEPRRNCCNTGRAWCSDFSLQTCNNCRMVTSPSLTTCQIRWSGAHTSDPFEGRLLSSARRAITSTKKLAGGDLGAGRAVLPKVNEDKARLQGGTGHKVTGHGEENEP
jgi:hypothetical protein